MQASSVTIKDANADLVLSGLAISGFLPFVANSYEDHSSQHPCSAIRIFVLEHYTCLLWVGI